MSIPREVLNERKRYKDWYEFFRPIKNSEDSSERYEVTDEKSEEARQN